MEELKSGAKHFQEICGQFDTSNSIKGLDFSRDTESAKTQVMALMDRYINGLKEHLSDRLTQQDGDTLCNFSAAFTLADGAIDDLSQLYGTSKVTKVVNKDETYRVC